MENSFKIGIFLVILLDIISVLSSEITEYILSIKHYKKPFFITFINSSFLSFGLIFYLIKNHLWSALYISKQAIPMPVEIEKDKASLNSNNCEPNEEEKLLIAPRLEGEAMQEHKYAFASVWAIAKIAPLFSLLFFLQNYSYNIALSKTAPSIVNVVSSASGFFVLLFGSFIPPLNSAQSEGRSVERFTLTKLFFACLTIIGVVIITVSDIIYNRDDNPPATSHPFTPLNATTKNFLSPITTDDHSVLIVPWGVIWALAGAVFYGVYANLLRRYHYIDRELSLFIGCVGLASTFTFSPFFPILNALGIEAFEMPSAPTQWLILLSTGILGTFLSNYIYLRACLLTSPLVVTLGFTLNIPMTIIYDVIVTGSHFPLTFFIGTLPIIVSFVGITLITS